MGGLLELAIKEARAAVTGDFSIIGGFSTLLTITPLIGEPFQIKGLATVHSSGFDQDGRPIISDNSHITFSELDVNELGYTTRVNGKLRIQGWKVEFSHAVGDVKAILSEPEPDSTLGIIRVMITKLK
jgi:hypothetical protein